MGAATVHLPVGVRTRTTRASGPEPSPPAATAEGRTTCALVNASAGRAGPSAPPGRPVRMITPDAHEAPSSVSMSTTVRTPASAAFDVDDGAADGATSTTREFGFGASAAGRRKKSRSARRAHAMDSAKGATSAPSASSAGFELAGTRSSRAALVERARGGVRMPRSAPLASRTGPPSIPGRVRASSIRSGADADTSSPGTDTSSPGTDTSSPGTVSSRSGPGAVPGARHVPETDPERTLAAKCDGAKTPKGDPHAMTASPGRGDAPGDHNVPGDHSRVPGDGVGTRRMTSPATATPTESGASPGSNADEDSDWNLDAAKPGATGAAPPTNHPRWSAPNPRGPARDSTAAAASGGTTAANAVAGIHSGSEPSGARPAPRRTCTSTPGASGPFASPRGAKKGTKRARGARRYSCSASASRALGSAAPPGPAPDPSGSRSADAEISVMDSAPASATAKNADDAAISPRGSGPRTRTVAVRRMPRRAISRPSISTPREARDGTEGAPRCGPAR